MDKEISRIIKSELEFQSNVGSLDKRGLDRFKPLSSFEKGGIFIETARSINSGLSIGMWPQHRGELSKAALALEKRGWRLVGKGNKNEFSEV